MHTTTSTPTTSTPTTTTGAAAPTRLLTGPELAAALSVRDLTDPAQGPHALQLLVAGVVERLAAAWGCAVRTVRAGALVPVEDNYDRLGFGTDTVTRDARYTRYASESCLLRSHTSAMVPPELRRIARSATPVGDVLLACPGIVYRRDSLDRLHTGTPHQLDLWRITDRTGADGATALGEADLTAMIGLVVDAALPGARWRTVPSPHPYTTAGRQVDVLHGGTWVEVGECGLAASGVLAGAGLRGAGGLAMGLGLDRLLMLRKGIDDIRLLRADDQRVAAQMRDLRPYRRVSAHPPVRRDLSVAVAAGTDAELVGDRVREALGAEAEVVEEVAVLSETPGEALPERAVRRLGLLAGQKNVLVRVVLRHPTGTLTDETANRIRDRIWAALHEGTGDGT